MTLMAHPGESLEEHLLNVKRHALAKLKAKKNAFNDKQLYEDLKKAVTLAALFHDIGKATDYFQRYLELAQKQTLTKQEQKELKSIQNKKQHSKLGAYFAIFYIQNKKINFNKKDIPWDFIIFLSILKHHSNFESLNDEYHTFYKKQEIIDLLLDQLENLDKKELVNLFFHLNIDLNSKDILSLKEFITSKKLKLFFVKKEYDIYKDISIYFYINFIFSLLIDSDKWESAYPSKKQINKDLIDLSSVIDIFKQKTFTTNKQNSLNKLREKAYKEVEKNIEKVLKDFRSKNKLLTVNLPTGLGKTLTAYNFSFKLQKKIYELYKYKPKIIYALPFISIIDQNADLLLSILKNFSHVKDIDDLLSINHSLAKLSYEESRKNTDLDIEEINYRKMFIESWDSDIVITTFVQLFNTLFTNKNKQLKKFHQLIGSIIILDEVQSLPLHYQIAFKQIANFLSKNFNTVFVLLTATMPYVFIDDEKESIIPLIKDPDQDYFKKLNRIKLIYDKKPKTIDEFTNDFIKNLQKDKSYLIIANTIKSSIEIYRKIEKVRQKDHEYKLFYLSTRVIPKHRLERIQQIRKLQKQGFKKIIAVSTQLIEAGVDVDFDIVYRDFAPLDSINQSAGRCNRNALKKGDDIGTVKLVELKNDKKSFFSYIYDPILCKITKDTFDKQKQNTFLEKTFYDLNIEFFKSILNKKASQHQKAKFMLNALQYLKYSCDNKDSCIDKFSIFENQNYETSDIFIAIDDDAKELYKTIEDIKKDEKSDRFEKKLKLSKLRSQIAKYIISVPDKTIPIEFLNKNKKFIYINTDEFLDKIYDKQLGWIGKQESEQEQETYLI